MEIEKKITLVCIFVTICTSVFTYFFMSAGLHENQLKVIKAEFRDLDTNNPVCLFTIKNVGWFWFEIKKIQIDGENVTEFLAGDIFPGEEKTYQIYYNYVEGEEYIFLFIGYQGRLSEKVKCCGIG